MVSVEALGWRVSACLKVGECGWSRKKSGMHEQELHFMGPMRQWEADWILLNCNGKLLEWTKD